MPFVIYEQGVRIHTPPDTIFPPRTVEQVNATKRTQKLSSQDSMKHAVRRWPRPDDAQAQTATEKSVQTEAELEQYRDIAEGEKKRQPVRQASQVMVNLPITINEAESLQTGWALFQQQKFRHLPVVSGNGQLVGMLSDRDILTAIIEQGDAVLRMPVASLMKQRVLSATPETEIRLIAGLMAENHIGALPIVNGEDQVIGIVARTDLLRTLLNQAPLELWA